MRTKFTVYSIAALLAVLILGPIGVQAAQVSLMAQHQNGAPVNDMHPLAPTESFYVLVGIDDATNVAGAALTIAYNSSVFQVDQINQGGESYFVPEASIFNIASGSQVDAVGNKDGVVGKVLLSGAAINTGTGGAKYTGFQILFKVRFKAIAPATAADIHLEQSQICNTAAGWGVDADSNGVCETYGTPDVLTGARAQGETGYPGYIDGFGGNLADDFYTISTTFGSALALPINIAYSIQGTISYGGSQPGNIYYGIGAQLVGNLLGGAMAAEGMLTAPGAYSSAPVPPGVYYVAAFKDVNGNGDPDPTEPIGVYMVSPPAPGAVTVVNQNVTGINLTLNDDTDLDDDGIWDLWELDKFGNLTTANATSDFDQDGYSDKQEYLNSTDPKVQNAPGGTGYNPDTDNRVAAGDKYFTGDFNGDGKNDILFKQQGTNTLWMYLMNGPVLLAEGSPGVVDPGWDILKLADFNGDGKTDILYGNATSGLLWVRCYDGLSIIAQNSPGAIASGWTIQDYGDFNGDGKTDILFKQNVTNTLWMYLMNGPVVLAEGSPGVVDPGWDILKLADFNGDSKTDILYGNAASGLLWVRCYDGLSIIAQNSPGAIASGWTIQDYADFNGDGKTDILFKQNVTNTLWMYLMNGPVLLAEGSPGVVDPGWDILNLADFNGDGKTDILYANTTSGLLWVRCYDGLSILQQNTPGAIASGWQVEDYVDFNNDGKTDILFKQNVTNTLWMYLMNGSVVLAEGSPGVVDPGWDIEGYGDFNADGKTDIMYINTTSGLLWVRCYDGLNILQQNSPGAIASGWGIVKK